MKKEFPLQPLVFVGQGDTRVLRFKENRIVTTLLDHCCKLPGKMRLDLNDIACKDFADWERCQFAQLIGYSVSGYSDLSYVSDFEYARVMKMKEPEEGGK